MSPTPASPATCHYSDLEHSEDDSPSLSLVTIPPSTTSLSRHFKHFWQLRTPSHWLVRGFYATHITSTTPTAPARRMNPDSSQTQLACNAATSIRLLKARKDTPTIELPPSGSIWRDTLLSTHTTHQFIQTYHIFNASIYSICVWKFLSSQSVEYSSTPPPTSNPPCWH